jgi:hypothetical protein
MSRIARIAIVGTIFLIVLMIAVYWWQGLHIPYEKPPDLTIYEERLCAQARETHGDYLIVVSVTQIWMERPSIRTGKKEVVWISRRRL